jgi:hypothetical protein
MVSKQLHNPTEGLKPAIDDMKREEGAKMHNNVQ